MNIFLASHYYVLLCTYGAIQRIFRTVYVLASSRWTMRFIVDSFRVFSTQENNLKTTGPINKFVNEIDPQKIPRKYKIYYTTLSFSVLLMDIGTNCSTTP